MIYLIFAMLLAFGGGMLIGTRVVTNTCKPQPARVEKTILPPEAEDVI